ncbi:MAG: DUF1810 family protein [Bacteroidaceae bacterium]|nr:DUF1810 family protein [Bacteroidaceae bacterium]
MLGEIGAVKVRSCMTLFDAVSPDDIFQEVLDAFYGGTPDKRTYQECGLDCQTIGPGFSLADWHVENRAK